MSYKILVGILIFIIVILASGLLFFVLINRRESVDPDSAVETTRVSITADGFEPATIKVKVGTTVTWTNEDTKDHIVASDPHPIHTDHGDFESKRIKPGESYSYTFTEVDNYEYHCHIRPGMKGVVIVEAD